MRDVPCGTLEGNDASYLLGAIFLLAAWCLEGMGGGGRWHGFDSQLCDAGQVTQAL